MKALKIGGIGLGGLIALLFVIGLFLPSKFEVSRTIVIRAPAASVYAQLVDLRQHEAWSPWEQADPSIVNTYSDDCVGEGAWASWTSEHSGHGTMTLTRVVDEQRVEFVFEFERGKQASGYWQLEPVDDGVRVVWVFAFDAGWNIPHRYVGLVAESMIGPHFETGLELLKELVEAAPPMPEAPGKAGANGRAEASDKAGASGEQP